MKIHLKQNSQVLEKFFKIYHFVLTYSTLITKKISRGTRSESFENDKILTIRTLKKVRKKLYVTAG